jgi:RNA polymerase sigma-70 factor (ECF subfamily)
VVEEDSDAVVIGRSLSEPASFATVYDRHAGLVFRFLVRRVGRDAADELLGETFRIAFERRSSFDTERPNARPWLYGIATNLLARHRRTEARRLRATARLASSGVPGSVATDAVEAALVADEVLPQVVEAVAGLPDGERDVLMLYAWEELSYDDIAAALDIPVGTVRSRLNRARQRLRELTPATGEEEGRIGS